MKVILKTIMLTTERPSDQDKSKVTKLANHTWALKNNKMSYMIKWKIIEKFNRSKKYRLCLGERAKILFRSENPNSILN